MNYVLKHFMFLLPETIQLGTHKMYIFQCQQEWLKRIKTALLSYCLIKTGIQELLGRRLWLTFEVWLFWIRTKALKISVPHCTSDIFCINVMEVKIEKAITYRSPYVFTIKPSTGDLVSAKPYPLSHYTNFDIPLMWFCLYFIWKLVLVL